jgi:phospholipid N-methyltransferase
MNLSKFKEIESADSHARKFFSEDYFLIGLKNATRPDRFFGTDERTAIDMVSLIKNQSPKYALEPCAGEGTILRHLIPELSAGSKIHFCEIDNAHYSVLNEIAKYSAHAQVRCKNLNFFDHAMKWNKGYDLIIMNPPFKGIPNYSEFISTAYQLLNSGGQLISLIPSFGLARLKTNKEMLLAILSCDQVQIRKTNFDCNYGAKTSIISLIK